MRTVWAWIVVALIVVALPASAHAKASSKGEIGLELRAFEPDDLDVTEDYGAAVATRLEAKIKAKPFRAQARVFTRSGLIDGDRSHLVIEEAWLQWRQRSWKLRVRAGWQLLNWTATEAFHPADVVNARNLDSNVENPDKLGEPMLSARIKAGQGSVSAYYMPLRVTPILPGRNSRLSFAPREIVQVVPLPRAQGGPNTATVRLPVFVADREDPELSHQFALRGAQRFGSADVAVHAIRHHDRSQPTFDLELNPLTLRPRFHRVNQLGLTYAHALDEWVVKVEAVKRMFDDDAQPGHYQVAGGLEWGWGYDGGGEGTVLLEGQAVLGVDAAAQRKQLHPFQRDALVGYRHAFNDVDGTELLVGVMFDLEDEQVLANTHLKRRLTDTLTVEASLRIIHAPDGDPRRPVGLQTLHGTRYGQLAVRHHF